MNLETQVRDRNLNPKSACVKRRSDSGSEHSHNHSLPAGQHLNPSFNPETEPVVSLEIFRFFRKFRFFFREKWTKNRSHFWAEMNGTEFWSRKTQKF